MRSSAIFFTTALVGVASATEYRIAVGKDGLAFTPSTIDAAQGDTITFDFAPSTNHSVTQSTFKVPCTFNGSIDSGFINNDHTDGSNISWTIPVNDTKPVWFFCAQKDHCSKGMVFSVNAGNGKKDDGSATSADEYASIATASSASASTTGAAPATTSDKNAAGSLTYNAVGLLAVLGSLAGLML